MDRIPTTITGALSGDWDTTAGPTAGMQLGRFGERRVSVAPETPHPSPGRQGQGTGSGVASIDRPEVNRFRNGDRGCPDERPAGCNGNAATSSGASRSCPAVTVRVPPSTVSAHRSGAVRVRPRIRHRAARNRIRRVSGQTTFTNGREACPNRPRAVCYRSRWEAFARWCLHHSVPYWPASPETVADYLKTCAAKYSALAIRTIRSAIASAHRRAGLADPCATGCRQVHIR